MNQADSASSLLRQLDTAIKSGHRTQERSLRRLLNENYARPEIAVQTANIYWRAGRTQEAREILTETSLQHPDDPRVWLSLAVFLCRLKEFEASLPVYERAIELAPADGTSRHRYGWALSTIGRTADAITQLQKAVTLDPANAAAHYLLSTLHVYAPNDPHLDQLRNVLQQPLSPRQRSRLYFALGRALEQTGEYAGAFDSYLDANRLRRADLDFQIETEKEHIEWLIANFHAEGFADSCGHSSETPVFLVGMPRSGSTLLEHMLSCHPEIAGAGETPLFMQSLNHSLGSSLMPGSPAIPLPAAGDKVWRSTGKRYVDDLRQLAGFKSRIVDKQLFNYYALGAIAMALPGARIIYCTRDPRDMAVSCFTTAFREGRPWAYDLDELCSAWALHRKLMSHWHKVLPGRIFELKYEELIDDPEAQLRLLLSHIGVDWSDECLGFSQSTRPVETSSRGQVSRPLFNESVGRWQRFADQLRPYLSRLV